MYWDPIWGISILADFRPMGLRSTISVNEKKNSKPLEVQSSFAICERKLKNSKLKENIK